MDWDDTICGDFEKIQAMPGRPGRYNNRSRGRQTGHYSMRGQKHKEESLEKIREAARERRRTETSVEK